MNAFFEYLLVCDKSDFLMSASISGDELEKQRTDGLVEGHAYSLISVIKQNEDGN